MEGRCSVVKDATGVVRVVSRDVSQPVNLGRAASEGALAPEPLRATRIQPESIRIRANKQFFHQNPMVSLLTLAPLLRLNLAFWSQDGILSCQYGL